MRGETGLNFGTSRAEGRGLRSPSFIGMSKDCNFCQPPSPSSKSFKSPVLELKFSLAYLSVAALAPSHRVVEPGEAFSSRGTAAAPNKTQVFAGPILVPPLGQREGAQFFPIPRGHSSDRRATLFATLRSPLTSTSTITATIPSCLSPSSFPPSTPLPSSSSSGVSLSSLNQLSFPSLSAHGRGRSAARSLPRSRWRGREGTRRPFCEML